MFSLHLPMANAMVMDASTLVFFLLIIPLLSAASNDCPLSYCGQNINNVRYPFRLIDKQPQTCGFPGFNLRCIMPSMMLISISTSGEFAIRNIDYRSQAMRIYDPSNCLPARLSSLDLSNSPFSASYYQNYTLLSCPNDANLSGLATVGCLSNSSFSTLATASMSLVSSMTSNQTGCRVTSVVWVPVVAKQADQDGFTSKLEEDITLRWGTPDCQSCEADGLSCGYANSNTSETRCFFNDGVPKGSAVFKIIAFAMAIPAMAASLIIACFMCAKDGRREMMSSQSRRRITITPEEAAPAPSIVGLDQATIESYTKVVLGESKRLPGHDDAACPICLSEYHVKETVRCIPECRHCFHAECIDEWLKMNGSCPICRNSPSPVE